MLRIIKLSSIIISFFLIQSFVFGQAAMELEQEAISDKEFDTFISAFKEVQLVDTEAQKDITNVLEDNNLDINTFTQMQQAAQMPDTEIDASQEEMQNFETASQEIHEIQAAAQQEMQQKIQEEGLSIQRYQEIVGIIQQDPELMNRFQQEIQ